MLRKISFPDVLLVPIQKLILIYLSEVFFRKCSFIFVENTPYYPTQRIFSAAWYPNNSTINSEIVRNKLSSVHQTICVNMSLLLLKHSKLAIGRSAFNIWSTQKWIKRFGIYSLKLKRSRTCLLQMPRRNLSESISFLTPNFTITSHKGLLSNYLTPCASGFIVRFEMLKRFSEHQNRMDQGKLWNGWWFSSLWSIKNDH